MIGSTLGLLFLLFALLPAAAQPGQPPQLDPQLRLMMSQPIVEISTNVTASAAFDPPVVAAGELSTWRVSFSALDELIRWPETLVAPPELELRLSARGQTLLTQDGKLQPKTTLNHRVRAASTGRFTLPEFQVEVYGRRVVVPASTLEVMPGPPTNVAPLRLIIELSATDIYVGQPVNLRVLMPAISNQVQALADLRVNAEGFLVDQGTARHCIGVVPFRGSNVTAYLYEAVITPLNSGQQAVSAQAFTAGNRFSYPISIQGQVSIPGGVPQYVLLDADPVAIRVRIPPPEGELPGFTGAIGQFTLDPPRLSTNRVRVGDPVNLSVTFRSLGSLNRFVAPLPPAAGAWQVFDAVATAAAAVSGGTNSFPSGYTAGFIYTMIPLTNGLGATPAIPFSYFDSERRTHVDLSIPSMPITVVPGKAPVDSQVLMAAPVATTEEKKLSLSPLAALPGRGAPSLAPLQQRGWFLLVQLLPVLGFVGLWCRDRRLRFLELHPDILLRRRARRALRREQRALQRALRAGDAPAYAAVAVRAMRVAAAPHFPAEPRALVGGDVLELIGAAAPDHRAETVRRFFAVADAAQFSGATADAANLLTLEPELARVLAELEARL